MKIHSILFIHFLLLITMESFTMNEDTLLMRLLPDSSYLPVESEKIYSTDHELYDYINGGAELYLNYGFKKMAKRIYTLPDGNEIKAEIFNMKEPKNAYGIFSYAKQEINIGIGQGAQYIGGSLIFWQDHYFVSVFALKETEQSKEEVRSIGKKISETIGKAGQLPAIFKVIPQKSLMSESTFYFYHPAWQNKFLYISNDNIFNLNENVDAILNKYGEKENRHYLLLIKYPNHSLARKALKQSRENFAKELKKQSIVQTEEGKWIGYELEGQLLIFVFDAPSEKEGKELLNQVAENYRLIEKGN